MDTARPTSELAPTDFLQLIGHPLRWRLLGELTRSDRTVQELTGLLGEPQNLVSYHLGKLRNVRLVSMQQSAADRRDSYYTVDLTRFGGLLSHTAASLHPGLRLVALPTPRAAPTQVRVLFLCTGNSARSQMAEGLARVLAGGAIEAYSAGSVPKPLHANALKVMRKVYGIDLTSYTSKHVSVFAGQRFDFVISLCDRVRELCPELLPEFRGKPTAIHWSIRNPAAEDVADKISYPAFQQTAAELETRLRYLLAVLTDQMHAQVRAKP